MTFFGSGEENSPLNFFFRWNVKSALNSTLHTPNSTLLYKLQFVFPSSKKPQAEACGFLNLDYALLLALLCLEKVPIPSMTRMMARMNMARAKTSWK